MAKLADNILKILSAAGVKLEEKQTVAIKAIGGEEDVAAELQTIFDHASNEVTGEMSKMATKAGTIDKFDESLNGWADILGDDVKEIVKQKGAQKLDLIKGKILAKIEEAKKAASSGDGDVSKLRGEITALELKYQQAEATRLTEIEGIKATSANELFNYQLLSKVQGRKDIADAYARPDALEGLVLPSILKYAESQGLKINRDFSVVKKDTETPYIKNSQAVTIDGLMQDALDHNKFRKNAPAEPPKSTVEIDNNSKASKASFLRPQPINE